MNYGLDLMKGEVIDNVKAGVLEPTISKVRSLKSALEAATSLLRIDDGEYLSFLLLFSAPVRRRSPVVGCSRTRTRRRDASRCFPSFCRFVPLTRSLVYFLVLVRSHPSRTGAEGRGPPRRTLESEAGGKKKKGKGRRGERGGAVSIERVFRLTLGWLGEREWKPRGRGRELFCCIQTLNDRDVETIVWNESKARGGRVGFAPPRATVWRVAAAAYPYIFPKVQSL